MSDVPVDLPAPPGEPTPDTEFLALLDKLSPVLVQLQKATLAEAIATTPVPTFRPGAVQGVNAAERTASVLVDGDTAPITAQVLTDTPGVNDRVMLCFVPPSAVFLTGLITASGVPAGVMMEYAGPITHHANAETGATSGAPPRGWLWCAGQEVSRADYPALFAAIGTTHGAGNGTTTFNVPDRRGRIALPLDNMGGTDAGRVSASNTLGATGGAETHTLAIGNLPAHNHSIAHTHGYTPAGTVSMTSVTIGNESSHVHSVSNLVASTQGIAAGTDYTGDVNTTSFNSGPGSSHTHSFSGTPSFSGTAADTTSQSTTTSGDAGSGTAVNHLPPYMTCHIIIKA